jgi:predicted permease
MVFAQLLFPDFALILCGYLVCRHTPLNRTVWEPVEMLVYFLLFPILLFHSIVKSPLDLSATSSLIGAGWALALTGIALAYSLPYWPWLRRFVPAREYAASAQVAFRFNSFIALALAERLAGPQGLLLIAVLIGVCVPLMNVAAVWPMARQGQRGFLRELIRNPLILGTGSGLLANLLGVNFPTWLEPTVSRMGAASLPLGLMAAGAGMHLGALGHTKALSAALACRSTAPIATPVDPAPAARPTRRHPACPSCRPRDGRATESRRARAHPRFSAPSAPPCPAGNAAAAPRARPGSPSRAAPRPARRTASTHPQTHPAR